MEQWGALVYKNSLEFKHLEISIAFCVPLEGSAAAAQHMEPNKVPWEGVWVCVRVQLLLCKDFGL